MPGVQRVMLHDHEQLNFLNLYELFTKLPLAPFSILVILLWLQKLLTSTTHD
jgi:hypothetical protein